MRKALLLILLSVLGCTLAAVETTPAGELLPRPDRLKATIAAGAGMRMFTESQMKDAYGSSLLTYGGEFCFFFSRRIAVALEGGYLSASGKSSYEPAQEDLKFTIASLELGPKIFFGKSKFKPFLAILAGYYFIKEEAGQIGTVDKKQFGFAGALGAEYYLSGKIFLQVKAKYLAISLETDSKMNLGGLGLGLALGIGF
jgi:outer membrane protein W